MPQYKINSDGSRTVKSRYSKKGVCTLEYIFPTSPATAKKFIQKKKGCESVNLQKTYSVHDNSALVRRIFTRFLLKMLTRVADGELFVMPGTTKTNITLKQIPDEDVKKIRQKGFYADYDIVKAGFKIPMFSYDFGPYTRKKDIRIYVPSTLMQRALRNAENRQIQWTYIPKTFDRDVRDE